MVQRGHERERAWAESDYILPESVTRGQSKLDMEIRPMRVGWTPFAMSYGGYHD